MATRTGLRWMPILQAGACMEQKVDLPWATALHRHCPKVLDLAPETAPCLSISPSCLPNCMACLHNSWIVSTETLGSWGGDSMDLGPIHNPLPVCPCPQNFGLALAPPCDPGIIMEIGQKPCGQGALPSECNGAAAWVGSFIWG